MTLFKDKYQSLINHFLKICILVSLLFFIPRCEEATFSNELFELGSVTGQVFSIGFPGPVPIGWVPPPYQQFCTIIVMNERNNIIKEVLSNQNGAFNFNIEPGIYYFGLRESPIKSITGPFKVEMNKTIYVDVYYDNGMR